MSLLGAANNFPLFTVHTTYYLPSVLWEAAHDDRGEPMTTGEAADASVAAGLLRLSFLVQGVFARASERHDLTPAQARLLCILAGRPRGMAELAGLLRVEEGAVTVLVDRVERRGLAERAD